MKRKKTDDENEEKIRLVTISTTHPKLFGTLALRGRVVAKSELREYHNDKGPGKVFSVDLMDESSATIRATAFNQEADRLFPKLLKDKLYLVQHFTVKPSNGKFNTTGHPYELMLNKNTKVIKCPDDGNIQISIPLTKLVKIGDMVSRANETVLDIMGIVTQVSAVEEFTSKAGKEMTKQTLTLVDDSLYSIDVTLWNPPTDNTFVELSIVAIRNVQIHDFRDCRNLQTKYDFEVLANEKLKAVAPEEYQRLLTFLDSEEMSNGRFSQLACDTSSAPHSDECYDSEMQKTLAQAVNDPGNMSWCMARVTDIRCTDERPPWYWTCPKRECKGKKLMSMDADFQCPECNETVPKDKAEPRYMVHFKLTDESRSVWATAFGNAAQKLLSDMSVEFLSEMKEKDREGFDQMIQNAKYQLWLCHLSVQLRGGEGGGGGEDRNSSIDQHSLFASSGDHDSRNLQVSVRAVRAPFKED